MLDEPLRLSQLSLQLPHHLVRRGGPILRGLVAAFGLLSGLGTRPRLLVSRLDGQGPGSSGPVRGVAGLRQPALRQTLCLNRLRGQPLRSLGIGASGNLGLGAGGDFRLLGRQGFRPRFRLRRRPGFRLGPRGFRFRPRGGFRLGPRGFRPRRRFRFRLRRLSRGGFRPRRPELFGPPHGFRLRRDFLLGAAGEALDPHHHDRRDAGNRDHQPPRHLLAAVEVDKDRDQMHRDLAEDHQEHADDHVDPPTTVESGDHVDIEHHREHPGDLRTEMREDRQVELAPGRQHHRRGHRDPRPPRDTSHPRFHRSTRSSTTRARLAPSSSRAISSSAHDW